MTETIKDVLETIEDECDPANGAQFTTQEAYDFLTTEIVVCLKILPALVDKGKVSLKSARTKLKMLYTLRHMVALEEKAVNAGKKQYELFKPNDD